MFLRKRLQAISGKKLSFIYRSSKIRIKVLWSLGLGLNFQHFPCKHCLCREGIHWKPAKEQIDNENSTYNQPESTKTRRMVVIACPCISLSHLSTHDMWYSWEHGRTRISSPSSYSTKQMWHLQTRIVIFTKYWSRLIEENRNSVQKAFEKKLI